METIYQYSRKDAINDGYQVNIDSLSNGLSKEAGIKYPVYLTCSVEQVIDESLRYGCNDINGVLWDIFTMFKLEAKKSTSSSIQFKVFIYWKNKPKLFTFFAEIGATDFDDPSPAITIMTAQDL